MYLGARSAPSEGQTLRQVVLLSKPSGQKLENRGPNHASGGRRAAGGWQAGSGQGLGSWLGVQGQPASEAWGYPGGGPIPLPWGSHGSLYKLRCT